jgi:L-asparaginase II
VLAADGCSIPTFGAPIQSFARAFAVLSDPEEASWDGHESWRPALIRLREAILEHPELVSGQGEIDTVIMQETQGRVLAKLGAEGLLCLAIPEHRLGVAISDDGGSTRSLGPATVAVLEQLGVEDMQTLAALSEQLCPPIESFAGSQVGETRPALRLEPSPDSGERAFALRNGGSPRSDIASIH